MNDENAPADDETYIWPRQNPSHRAWLVGGGHDGVMMPMLPEQQRVEIATVSPGTHREDVPEKQWEAYTRRPIACEPAVFGLEGMSDAEVLARVEGPRA